MGVPCVSCLFESGALNIFHHTLPRVCLSADTAPQGLPVRELLQHTYLIRRRQLLCEAVLFAGFIGVFFAVCFTIYDVSKAFQTNDAFIDLFLDEEFSDSNYKKVG
jgi:hypothetical protein